MSPKPEFHRYYRYEELTELLCSYVAAYPDWVELESIGKSFEGRDIWLLSITDRRSGTPDTKPAFWCDGNIHATEVSASTTILRLLHRLVGEGEPHGLLKTHTFYLVPRLNPDGAEWALESPPRVIRSSTRPYPFGDEDLYGVEPEDLDGDTRILSMRVPDPNGPWKISEEEPRLLKLRSPGEFGGSYYRLMPEGKVRNWDGIALRPRRRTQGLDLNRNYPSAWRFESEQRGAGDYPTSEPEVRAAVSAFVNRPNICGAIAFHTFSGVHLRPSCRYADDELPSEDLWSMKSMGQKGFEMTGYPAISVFHDFKYHPKQIITGTFDDWAYEHLGVYAWTTEIWSPQRQAGITDFKYIDWFREHPHQDDIKLLRWSDEKLNGHGFADWKPFNHPQLGSVEIGGWDTHFAFRNPPSEFLEAEVTPLADWAIWLASCSPRLTLRGVHVEKVNGTFRVRAAVQNAGWLPTHVTKLAQTKNLVRGIQAIVERPDLPHPIESTEHPSWLAGGKLQQDLGQLSGWNLTPANDMGWHSDSTTDIAVAEWTILNPGEYRVRIEHPRAGKLSTTVHLQD